MSENRASRRRRARDDNRRRATPPPAAEAPPGPKVNRGDHDRMVAACVAMLGRCGGIETQIRWSDDEQPTVWFAVVRFGEHQGYQWETAAGRTPLGALVRLCSQVIDGGQCKHCGRPSGFSEDIDTMPVGELVCWYQWDPELGTFRRGCE